MPKPQAPLPIVLCPLCGQPAQRWKVCKDFRTRTTTTVVMCCGGEHTAATTQAPAPL